MYLFASAIPSIAQDDAQLDLKSIPISDWLNAGETTEIPWTLIIRDAYLRMDQRLEVGYLTRIRAKDLNRLSLFLSECLGNNPSLGADVLGRNRPSSGGECQAKAD